MYNERMSKRKLAVAIFLNLFAMPGLGQMYLGKKARGAVVVGVVFFVLLALTVHIIQSVSAEADKIAEVGNDIFKIAQMTSEMSQSIMANSGFILRVYFFLLGVCYILSVTDLFWLYYDEPAPQQ